MTTKEKLFCYYFAKLQNHIEAAVKAGFDKNNLDIIGTKLLLKEDIKKQIDYIIDENKKNDIVQKTVIGLERLAFGSISDAVKLVFAEKLDDISNLSEMDLFNVSEIKKVKGGGFEIKFFDRLKALEKLIDISQISSNKDEQSDFLEAIKHGVSAISNDDFSSLEISND